MHFRRLHTLRTKNICFFSSVSCVLAEVKALKRHCYHYFGIYSFHFELVVLVLKWPSWRSGTVYVYQRGNLVFQHCLGEFSCSDRKSSTRGGVVRGD